MWIQYYICNMVYWTYNLKLVLAKPLFTSMGLLQNLAKVVANVQPAVDIIWSSGTEHSVAREIEANLVLWGLNLITLIPASFVTWEQGRRRGDCTRLLPIWPGFDSGLVATCGLSWLLILYSALRGFSPDFPSKKWVPLQTITMV